MSTRVGAIIFVVAWVNVMTFMVGAWWLGGDALNGRFADGHYFLSCKGTSNGCEHFFREVSPMIFLYSWCHAFSAFAGMIVGIWAVNRTNRPSAT
jgi:hypothetical protein